MLGIAFGQKHSKNTAPSGSCHPNQKASKISLPCGAKVLATNCVYELKLQKVSQATRGSGPEPTRPFCHNAIFVSAAAFFLYDVGIGDDPFYIDEWDTGIGGGLIYTLQIRYRALPYNVILPITYDILGPFMCLLH